MVSAATLFARALVRKLIEVLHRFRLAYLKPSRRRLGVCPKIMMMADGRERPVLKRLLDEICKGQGDMHTGDRPIGITDS